MNTYNDYYDMIRLLSDKDSILAIVKDMLDETPVGNVVSTVVIDVDPFCAKRFTYSRSKGIRPLIQALDDYSTDTDMDTLLIIATDHMNVGYETIAEHDLEKRIKYSFKRKG